MFLTSSFRFVALFAIASPLTAFAEGETAPRVTAKALIFENEILLERVRSAQLSGRSPYAKSVAAVTAEADAVLRHAIDPVTNKTQVPPSGDKRDYLSIAPYWWPDPSKPDGLPWIRRDGKVNPQTRGDHTDARRLSAMFDDLDTLNVAYYITRDRRYAERLTLLLGAWFVEPKTRVNPEIRFGQFVPGLNEGRPAGLIEWHGIDGIVTAAQLLKRDNAWTEAEQNGLDRWLRAHLDFLTTGEISRGIPDGIANGSTWHDVMRMGLLMYFGRDAEARAIAERAKGKRIAEPIEPNGAQTAEVARTKSINYSILNLRGLVRLAVLARELKVDLFGYVTSDGRSIAKAVDFLAGYANGTSGAWPYQQITSGGVDDAINRVLKPSVLKFELWSERQALSDAVRAEALARLSGFDKVKFAIPD